MRSLIVFSIRSGVQMATTHNARNLKPVDLAAEHNPTAQADKTSFIGGLRFDWLSVVLTGWLLEPTPRPIIGFLPMMSSLTLSLSVITFITQFAQPFGLPLLFVGDRPAPSAEYLIIIGTTSILLHTALMIGPMLLVLRRWTLPFGSLTLVFTLNAALLSTHSDTYPAILAAL